MSAIAKSRLRSFHFWMAAFLLLNIFIAMPIAVLNGQSVGGRPGSLSTNGNNVFTGSNTFSQINNVIYIDGTKYPINQTGFTNALSDLSALGGGTLVYPNASITFSSQVACPVNVPIRIVGSGQTSVMLQNFSSTTHGLLDCQGTETATSTTLTSSANIGDLQLIVTSSSSFTVGDWIEIFDTTVPCNTVGQCNYEIHKIDSKPDNTHINLDTSMVNAIASGTSTVKKILPVFLSLEHLKLDASQVTNTFQVYCQFCIDFQSEDVKIVTSPPTTEGVGFYLLHSKYARIAHGSYDGAPGTNTPGQNYGIPFLINAATSDVTVTGNTFRRIEESVVGEKTYNFSLTGNTYEGCNDSCFNTHQPFVDSKLVATGNVFEGGTQGSTVQAQCINISSLSQDIVLTGNTCSNYGLGGFSLIGLNSSSMVTNVVVTGNTFRHPAFNLSVGNGAAITATFVRGLVATGNTIEEIATNEAGMQLTNNDQFAVNGNVIAQTNGSATSEVCLYIVNSTNGSVSGNVITGCHAQGLRIDSTNAGNASCAGTVNANSSSCITIGVNNVYNNTANYLTSANATNIFRVININDSLTTLSTGTSAPSSSGSVGYGFDTTTNTPNFNANAGTTSSFSGSWSCLNVTPVTVNTATTNDQNLMACTIPAGTLNKVLRGLRIYAAGVYSTAATSTAQMTMKAKVCTVSGCGSGTVLAVCNIQTIALASITVTNNTWTYECLPVTQTAGASAAFERSGKFSIDLGSLTTAADSIFIDPNATGTLGTIDETAQLFLQITAAFSGTTSTSNTYTERQLLAETVN